MEKKVCTIKEVQKLIDCGKTKASDMIRLCRDALGKDKPKPLFLSDFKQYYEIN